MKFLVLFALVSFMAIVVTAKSDEKKADHGADKSKTSPAGKGKDDDHHTTPAAGAAGKENAAKAKDGAKGKDGDNSAAAGSAKDGEKKKDDHEHDH